MKLILPRVFTVLRERPFLSACVALTLALAGLNYFLWQRHAAATQRHEQALHNGEFMVHALTSRHKIETDLAALSAGMQHIEENLIDEPSMEVNLGYFYRFERMTRTHLLHLDQLTAPVTATKSRFKVVPFSLQLGGSYLGCMNFLRALENGPRVMRLRQCHLERIGETSSDLVLSLTVEVLANP